MRLAESLASQSLSLHPVCTFGIYLVIFFMDVPCRLVVVHTAEFLFLTILSMFTLQAREGGNMTAVTTKTQNVHGDELIVTTTSPYEAEVFASRADWRVRMAAMHPRWAETVSWCTSCTDAGRHGRLIE